MESYGKAIASIESTDDDDFGPNGGFTAVLSTPSLDRDGDRLHRDEWIEPLQERYPLDIDHGMSVSDTIGSFQPYFEGDVLMMRAAFASTPKAQEVRTLIQEGHIRNVSVAFMTDKSKKDSEPRRELLNAGVVATPSNRDAVILASKAASALKDALSDATEGDVPEEVKAAVLEALSVKAPKPYGDVHYADPGEGKYPVDTVEHIRAALRFIGEEKNRAKLGDHLASTEAAIHAAARAHGIDPHSAGKSFDAEAFKNAIADIWVKAGATASGVGGDGALVQAIHDASSHLGAACPVIEVSDEDSGASSGANKSVDEVVFTAKSGQTVTFGSHADAREFFTDMIESLDSAEARDESLVEVEQEKSVEAEAFEKALDQVLTPEASTPEAPAPTDEVPAPASPVDEKAKRERALQFLHMRSQLLKT